MARIILLFLIVGLIFIPGCSKKRGEEKANLEPVYRIEPSSPEGQLTVESTSVEEPSVSEKDSKLKPTSSVKSPFANKPDGLKLSSPTESLRLENKTAQFQNKTAQFLPQSEKSSSSEAGLPSVRQIQQALKNAGYYKGKIDGILGPQTKKAIKKFQSENGLKVDGKVGPKTWEKLKVYLNSPKETSSQ